MVYLRFVGALARRSGEARIVVERDGRVIDADSEARAAGVALGERVRPSFYHRLGLRRWSADALGEADLKAQLERYLMKASPSYRLDGMGAFVADEPAAEILAALETLGDVLVVGFGESPFIAKACTYTMTLPQRGTVTLQGERDALPVRSWWPLSAAARTRLARLDLHNAESLRRFGLMGLKAALGKEAELALALAVGMEPRSLGRPVPPLPAARLVLHGTRDALAVTRALQQAATDIAAQLISRHLRAEQLHLRIEGEDGTVLERACPLLRPSAATARLAAVLRKGLLRLEDASLDSGLASLSVRVTKAAPGADPQPQALFYRDPARPTESRPQLRVPDREARLAYVDPWRGAFACPD